jgi:RNA polymerase sigma-70 factor (sigma-E family)
MTVILVFPQSCGGFWGGVTECGLGSTGSAGNVAKSCPSAHRSGVRVGGEPVSTTVVDNQSTEAARGSPVGDPILGPEPEGGSQPAPGADVTPNAEISPNDVMPDGARPEPAGAADAAPNGGAPNGTAPEAVEGAGDVKDAGAEVTDVAHVVEVEDNVDVEVAEAPVEAGENSGNLDGDGEPRAPQGRPTEVTATLSESDLLLEDPPADEALAPDTFATSAFDAEEARTPVVWDAADVVTEIYHGHYNQLVRLAVLLVHDVQTAEEVVQDAFEAMHLAWRRLRDSEKALQYLRQTVVNRSRSVLRHRKVVDMHAPKPAPDEPSAEHAALALLERSAVAAALRSLPERQREAIALRYYADFSEADIARAMGISKGAVKSHTARAMASLKTILSQETP